MAQTDSGNPEYDQIDQLPTQAQDNVSKDSSGNQQQVILDDEASGNTYEGTTEGYSANTKHGVTDNHQDPTAHSKNIVTDGTSEDKADENTFGDIHNETSGGAEEVSAGSSGMTPGSSGIKNGVGSPEHLGEDGEQVGLFLSF